MVNRTNNQQPNNYLVFLGCFYVHHQLHFIRFSYVVPIVWMLCNSHIPVQVGLSPESKAKLRMMVNNKDNPRVYWDINWLISRRTLASLPWKILHIHSFGKQHYKNILLNCYNYPYQLKTLLYVQYLFAAIFKLKICVCIT